jgi:hypothetical protein
VIIAVLTLLMGPLALEDAKNSVVGLWLGESRTQGGLGNWIDFRADGTVESGFGALVGGLLDTYQLDGTALKLRVFSGKATPAGAPVFESIQKQIRIEGDRAVVEARWPANEPAPGIESPDEQAMFDRMRQPTTMARVGPPTTPLAAPIVGTWSYQHHTGATAYETFTRGGRWYLRVPMRVVHGRYTVTGGEVSVQLPGRSEAFARQDDVLVSAAAGRGRATYRRAPE